MRTTTSLGMQITSNESGTFLRRYTDLPAVLDILSNQRLTLLDPSKWEDKNDAYFMDLYKKNEGLKSLVALCFSMDSETYHHWRVFSYGSAGVCVEFDKAMLLADLSKVPGYDAHAVDYLKIDQVQHLQAHQLPFSKRLPFGPEKEFRVIVGSKIEEFSVLPVSISTACIKRITLSPWLPDGLVAPVRAALKNAASSANIKVSRTTLTSNDDWKRSGDEVLQRLRIRQCAS